MIIKKLLSVCVLIIISGCDFYIPAYDICLCTEFCEKNDGIQHIKIRDYNLTYCVCNKGEMKLDYIEEVNNLMEIKSQCQDSQQAE